MSVLPALPPAQEVAYPSSCSEDIEVKNYVEQKTNDAAEKIFQKFLEAKEKSKENLFYYQIIIPLIPDPTFDPSLSNFFKKKQPESSQSDSCSDFVQIELLSTFIKQISDKVTAYLNTKLRSCSPPLFGGRYSAKTKPHKIPFEKEGTINVIRHTYTESNWQTVYETARELKQFHWEDCEEGSKKGNFGVNVTIKSENGCITS